MTHDWDWAAESEPAQGSIAALASVLSRPHWLTHMTSEGQAVPSAPQKKHLRDKVNSEIFRMKYILTSYSTASTLNIKIILSKSTHFHINAVKKHMNDSTGKSNCSQELYRHRQNWGLCSRQKQKANLSCGKVEGPAIWLWIEAPCCATGQAVCVNALQRPESSGWLPGRSDLAWPAPSVSV